jgi:hypothetical protein
VSFDPAYNCCIGISKHATKLSEGHNVAKSVLTFSTISLSNSTASPQLLLMWLTQSWMMRDRPSGSAGRNWTSRLRNMLVCSSFSTISRLKDEVNSTEAYACARNTRTLIRLCHLSPHLQQGHSWHLHHLWHPHQQHPPNRRQPPHLQ